MNSMQEAVSMLTESISQTSKYSYQRAHQMSDGTTTNGCTKCAKKPPCITCHATPGASRMCKCFIWVQSKHSCLCVITNSSCMVSYDYRLCKLDTRIKAAQGTIFCWQRTAKNDNSCCLPCMKCEKGDSMHHEHFAVTCDNS